ncbi:MAG: hypothetical protein ACC656_12630, partial [Candidatus Heimdallarchaeota archaeon]
MIWERSDLVLNSSILLSKKVNNLDMSLSVEERINLVKEVGEEIIDVNELYDLFTSKLEDNEPIYAYDGFEPSGRIHIAQGLLRAINVNKLIKAGV